jgi:hypothetical protein
MALPTSYLTSFKNLHDIFEAIQSAQAPKKFTVAFLLGLGFSGTADRLVIGVLKALGFLTATGEPTQRYYAFLDQSQAARVLGEAIQEAYGDLFQVSTKAYDLSNSEVKNKLKTLTQGQFSDSVMDKMAGTFKALSALADFSGAPKSKLDLEPPVDASQKKSPPSDRTGLAGFSLGGLAYNIQIHLPESRDPAVYEALFRSLKEHLLQ